MNKEAHFNSIKSYYVQSAKAYENWGKDEERNGIYALHCGFERPGEQISHYDSVKALSREILSLAEIRDGYRVLDAGCGTGSIAFEAQTQYPNCDVFGINIATNQLIQANEYQGRSREKRVHFSVQDFGNTGFSAESFDNVIFSESIAHALSKNEALRESNRILKQGGSVTIADVFLKRNAESEDEISLLQDACRGWFIPDLLPISQLYSIMGENGLSMKESRDISQNILPSALRMRLNSERRLSEGASSSPIIEMSRRAVVAAHETVASGLVGYFLIHAKKTI